MKTTIFFIAIATSAAVCEASDCKCYSDELVTLLTGNVAKATDLFVQVQTDLAAVRRTLDFSLFDKSAANVRQIKAILESGQAEIAKTYPLDPTLQCEAWPQGAVCDQASIAALFTKLNELSVPLNAFLTESRTLACGDECNTKVKSTQALQYQSQCLLGVLADSLDKCAAQF